MSLLFITQKRNCARGRKRTKICFISLARTLSEALNVQKGGQRVLQCKLPEAVCISCYSQALAYCCGLKRVCKSEP